MSNEILIVDDEHDIRHLIQGILEDEGYKTRLAANSREAYAAIKERKPSLIILDIWLQGSQQDGLEILKNVREEFPFLPIIMISGHGTIETAVSSIKQGAYDFIEKPFKSDRLLLMIQRALETASLKQENASLKKNKKISYDIIGQSQTMAQLRQLLTRVAKTNSRVLLTGEAGVGKDLCARYIHFHSPMAQKPFIAINCASLTPESLEAYFRPSGSTANGSEKSEGATLFFEEICDMSAEVQARMIRLLQEHSHGKEAQNEHADIRIISSSNRDPESRAKSGAFREDLFYRLKVVPVDVPPLKRHTEDIADLCTHFVNVLNAETGLPVQHFSEGAIAAMKAHDWPGNVRQLRNVVEWTLIMKGGESGGTIEREDLPPEVTGYNGSKTSNAKNTLSFYQSNVLDLSLREARELFEKDYLQAQIKRFDGNISRTAQFIGMERSALHRKLKSLAVSEEQQNDKQPALNQQEKKVS